MKKFICLLVVVITIFFGISCKDEHVHTYDDNWSYDSEVHYHKSKCEHDVKSNEENHNYKEEIIKESTHLEKGLTKYTCIVCEYSKEEETDTIEHEFGNVYSYDEECHFYICECGEKDNVEAHDYKEEIIKEPTHLEKGEVKYTCLDCGYNKSLELDTLAHEFESVYSYDEENHFNECECGEKDNVEAHDYKEEILKEATHLEKGEAKYTCILCDYYKVLELDKLAHEFNTEYSFDEENHFYECDCGEKTGIEAHDFGEGETVVEETRLTDGLKIYTCKCGKVKEEVVKAIGFNVDSAKNTFYLITTSAGSDISKSVGISWHSNVSGSSLVYKKVNEDLESNNYIEVKPTEEYWSIEESYMDDPYSNKRYVCNVILDDLEPNTTYSYKIICDDTSSNDLTFTTASSDNSKYRFLSFVDFQYSENQRTLNLVSKFVQNTPNANLITCSGDFTDEGYSEASHRFLFDSTVFSSSILAFGAGDHEYWGSDKSPIKMLKRPYSYNKLFNNPKNGCEEYLNTSYYFRYNTSLFVFLDCGDSNVSSTHEMFTKQAKWLDNVLTNEKDYDFIIVCMHKSLYGDPKQDSTVRKFAPVFTEIFDKHKVDIVISGHDHEYSRTIPIANGMASQVGTVYLDLGNSGSKTRATGDDVKSSSLYDKYIDIKEKNYSLGIVGTVDNDELTIDIRNQDYQTVDKVKITKKTR